MLSTSFSTFLFTIHESRYDTVLFYVALFTLYCVQLNSKKIKRNEEKSNFNKAFQDYGNKFSNNNIYIFKLSLDMVLPVSSKK